MLKTVSTETLNITLRVHTSESTCADEEPPRAGMSLQAILCASMISYSHVKWQTCLLLLADSFNVQTTGV